MKPKVAINGFGRIGKNILRIWLENPDQIEIVALNSTSGPKAHAHLFKYDSIYGVLNHSIDSTDDAIIIDGKPILFFSEKESGETALGKAGFGYCDRVYRKAQEEGRCT